MKVVGVMHLFVVADERYCIPLAVLLRSIMESHATEFLPSIHVFTLGMSRASRTRVEGSVPGMQISWTDLTSAFPAGGLRAASSLAPATWGRLYAADLMSRSCDKAVYLDVDMLVVSDLSALWEIDLAGHPVAAVPAPGNPQVCCPAGGLYGLWKQLNLNPRTPYLQAGLLVVDLIAWRQRDMTALVANACTRHGDLFHAADQDALNYVLQGDFEPLQLRWNQTSMLRGKSSWAYCFFPEDEVDEARSRPVVIHFSGGDKPWQAWPGRSREDALWWSMLSRTTFNRMRPSWTGIFSRKLRRRLADRLRP